jgi:hypothetical protein
LARERLTFRQRDVTAAIKAIERAGHKVAKIEIGKDGCIIVVLVPPVGSETTPEPEPNPWDRVFEDAYKP